ncbi:MAG: PD-(D/E)XK nuclease family protein [Candidatus Cloacimonadales bacterium]
MKFQAVNFDQDITRLVLQKHRQDHTLFLFPTIQARNLALKYFQKDWNFSQSDFFTLEDWKYSQFQAQRPLLKEEKRSLAWFLSLDEASKEYFNISDYFSAIQLAQKFFSFWEEINEELVTEQEIEQVLAEKITAGEWQQNTFEQLQKIKKNYRRFIQQLDFTDKIFAYCQSNLRLKTDYREVVVVNQFYLTNLEKYLLQQPDNVTLYHQYPQRIFDQQNLQQKAEISAQDLINIRTQKITEIRSSEDFSMICALFRQLQEQQPSALVDFRFAEQAYSNFFSQKYFAVNTRSAFPDSSIYRWFFLMHKAVSQLFYHEKILLLPLQTALELFSCSELLRYYSQDWQAAQSKILDLIYKLVEQDFQYLDLELNCLQEQKLPAENSVLLKKILSEIKQLYQISNMQQFNQFVADFSSPRLLSASEKKLSNILEQFAQIKSDFKILDQLDLVKNWQDIFKHKNFAAAALKLFLDYMQPKPLQHKLTTGQRQKITALQDTRNLLYDQVFVLNVSEGVLPPKRKTPFLLSENQRQSLGLKTYEDIRSREKYYFYRLLAQSRQVILFSIENLEENREVSSFAEELRLNLPQLYQLSAKAKYSYQHFYQKYLGNLPADFSPPKVEADFHRISFRPEDFPAQQLKLSYYRWQSLQENPYEYFIKYQAQLKEREYDLAPQYSGKLIGNMTHEVFNLIWQRILELYQGNKIHHNFHNTNKNYVDTAFSSLLANDREMIFKRPHNYSQRYFELIFLPILKFGIINFFAYLDQNFQLSDQQITVLPEKQQTDSRLFMQVEDYQIFLRGKADLRIEAASQKYIFDYKTGSDNPAKKKKFEDQLIIYENIYYLLKKPELLDATKSYLYFVEKAALHTIKTTQKKDKAMVLADFKMRLQASVQQIISQGYVLSEKAGKYENIEITRRDLFQPREK